MSRVRLSSEAPTPPGTEEAGTEAHLAQAVREVEWGGQGLPHTVAH